MERNHAPQSHGGHQAIVMQALARVGQRWRAPADDDLLVALDDTDALDTPGTGFRARELCLRLAEAGLGRPTVITRHQLLVDPRVPYTSHNSAACACLVDAPDAEAAFALACDYLRRHAAIGSDVGLLVARRGAAEAVALSRWGARAKREVLSLDDARTLAADAGGRHAELTGTGGGLIGALAATGLHLDGDDGRVLWLRGLREAADHALPAEALAREFGLAARRMDDDTLLPDDAVVSLGPWPRAVVRRHQPVLIVEKNDDPAGPLWRCVPRDVVKRLSS